MVSGQMVYRENGSPKIGFSDDIWLGDKRFTIKVLECK